MTVLRNAIHTQAPPERVWSALAGGTRVDQTQEYTLRYGPVGAVLDVLFVRRRWDAGVKAFFADVEAQLAP